MAEAAQMHAAELAMPFDSWVKFVSTLGPLTLMADRDPFHRPASRPGKSKE